MTLLVATDPGRPGRRGRRPPGPWYVALASLLIAAGPALAQSLDNYKVAGSPLLISA